MELTTGENDSGRRLDRILRKALNDYPLALIHRLIRRKKVLVDGKPAKAQDRLKFNAKITILTLKEIPKTTLPVYPKHYPHLKILYEDETLISVNKPSGLAVHGPDSLDTMVHSYLKGKIQQSLSFIPGPLHRLDKPTSGIVVFSKSLEGAHRFSTAIREFNVQKTYLAIVKGTLKNEEIWQDELVRDHERKKTFVSENDQTGSKTAITKVIPLAAKNGFSLIQVGITTGRTHQIRAQAAFHKYPLLGDVKYGSEQSKTKSHKTTFFLHAWKLEFLEISIKAPLPGAFLDKITELFGDFKLF
ncbi:MAG: RluA family pseudouridine synthase [Treponema sp.]|jgi:23S rRNA pseudouridine955/2504/2580 synthase|nr:RluA family pseudouridine synthase [Treponema sp.]